MSKNTLAKIVKEFKQNLPKEVPLGSIIEALAPELQDSPCGSPEQFIQYYFQHRRLHKESSAEVILSDHYAGVNIKTGEELLGLFKTYEDQLKKYIIHPEGQSNPRAHLVVPKETIHIKEEFQKETGQDWRQETGASINPNYLHWLEQRAERVSPANPQARLEVKGNLSELEDIEDRGFVLKIQEYGKTVRQYHDTDYSRFMSVTADMVDDHLHNHSEQNSETSNKREVRNVQIHIYTI